MSLHVHTLFLECFGAVIADELVLTGSKTANLNGNQV